VTKKLIQELDEETKVENKEDFFANLHANTTADVNILTEEDDRLKKALKYKLLEKKDKLFYHVADQFGGEQNNF